MSSTKHEDKLFWIKKSLTQVTITDVDNNKKEYIFRIPEDGEDYIKLDLEFLASGGFNDTYDIKVSDCSNEQIKKDKAFKNFVIKKLKPKRDIQNEISGLEMQVKLSEKTKCREHINVCHWYDTFENNEGDKILLSLYDKFAGTLKDFEFRVCSIDTLLDVFLQCIDGLVCIHKYEILHSDIKEDNIGFQMDDGNIKIKYTDFGLSTDKEEREKNPLICKGATKSHSPLEIKNGKGGNEGSDVYSLGITFQNVANRNRFVYLTQRSKKDELNSSFFTSFSNLMISDQCEYRLSAKVLYVVLRYIKNMSNGYIKFVDKINDLLWRKTFNFEDTDYKTFINKITNNEEEYKYSKETIEFFESLKSHSGSPVYNELLNNSNSTNGNNGKNGNNEIKFPFPDLIDLPHIPPPKTPQDSSKPYILIPYGFLW